MGPLNALVLLAERALSILPRGDDRMASMVAVPSPALAVKLRAV
jgi:hypothetical protein